MDCFDFRGLLTCNLQERLLAYRLQNNVVMMLESRECVLGVSVSVIVQCNIV